MSIDPALRTAARPEPETRPDQVVVARTVEEAESMRGDWETAGVSDIDSDIDYFLTVVRHGPHVVRPHVVLIRRPGRPALMGIARLELLGVPLSVGYRTVLRPQLRAIVVTFGGLVGTAGADDERALIGELRRPLDTGEADMLLLRKIDVAGTLRDVVADGASWARRSHAQPETRHWAAAVPRTADEFLAGRSADTRSKLRRKHRQLERKYGDGLRLRRFQHPAEMAEMCRDMEAVASRTYQWGLGASYSGSPLELGLIELGMRRGWFRAWMLYLQDRPVAFWLGNKYAGNFSMSQTGFDPDYTRQSVGRYTLFRALEDLCAAGDVTWLDFGPGDADYKAAFAVPQRTESDVFVMRRGLRPVAVNLAATALSLVNGWGRHLAKETDWGRRLKRTWRRSKADDRTSGPAD